MSIAPVAEALRTEIIGQPRFLNKGNNRLHKFFCIPGHIADADFEPITPQMSQAQLVQMPFRRKDLEPVELEAEHIVDRDSPQADGLPGDSLAVLEPGVTKVLRWTPESMAEMADRLKGSQVTLLYEEIDMLTLAAGLIKWDLFYEKIFQLLLNSPADSREI